MNDTLDTYRKKIDNIDLKLLDLLQKRTTLSKKIGTFKKKNEMPIVDKDREKEKQVMLAKNAKIKGIGSDFVSQLWRIILDQSRRIQEGKS